MKEKDVHKLIEEQDKGKKAYMFEKFQKQHSLKSETHVVKHKKRIYVASIVAAAMAMLIIAIPLMINEISRDHKRYFTVDDCVATVIESTVKEYAIETNKNLLYIDWYDIAEEVRTILYVNKDNIEDILYIDETTVNSETYEIDDLYIFDELTTIDIFSDYEEDCTRTATNNNISVKWFYGYQISGAIFTYNGYNYIVQIQDPIEEDSVLKIIEEMI